jgi:hypothetical protein
VTVHVVWVGNRIYCTVTLLVTIHFNPISHPLQFAAVRTESSRPAVFSAALWYRLPTVDVLFLLGSLIVPMPQPEQLPGSQWTQLEYDRNRHIK